MRTRSNVQTPGAEESQVSRENEPWAAVGQDFLDVGQSWDLENEGTWRGIPSGVWAGEQAGDKQWS